MRWFNLYILGGVQVDLGGRFLISVERCLKREARRPTGSPLYKLGHIAQAVLE